MVYQIIDYSNTLSGVAAIIIAITLLVLIASYLPGKTNRYRNYMTNLIVVGKLRQLAVKEEVDIKEEELEFLKYVKLSDDRRRKTIDNEIEENLREKVEKELHDEKKSK